MVTFLSWHFAQGAGPTAHAAAGASGPGFADHNAIVTGETVRNGLDRHPKSPSGR